MSMITSIYTMSYQSSMMWSPTFHQYMWESVKV
jgi:hypothetical protein